MTREEILNMPAGRKMDALIAVNVFGWVNRGVFEIISRSTVWFDRPDGTNVSSMFLPHYSTDMMAAWKVYEKLVADCKPNSGEPDFIMLNAYPDGIFYIAKVWAHHDGEIVEFELTANTAPLAICRAALLTTLED